MFSKGRLAQLVRACDSHSQGQRFDPFAAHMKSLSGKNPALQSQKIFWVLVGVIILAGIFFRFWNLASDELTFDEGIYAFRSIGYLDYMENSAQVTPLQLYTDRIAPAWLSLSFPDAPPLFLIFGQV